MARPSWQPEQEQRTLVKSLSAMGLPQKQICAWMGMRSPKTLRKHFREELQQGARAEVVEVRTADESEPSGKCLSITVVLGVGASGSEARNNSGRKRVARLLASLQNSHGAASLAQSLTIQGAELLDRSASPLRILPEAKDLLAGAKRASMESESDRSRGGSKAGERNSGEGDRTLRQAEDEGLASPLLGAVWRRDEIWESGASVWSARLALAGESGRRTERTGAEASGGTSGRDSPAPVLARRRVGWSRCSSSRRSPLAAGGNGSETCLWGRRYRGPSPGHRLRISEPGLRIAESAGAAHHRDTLERLPLFRAQEGMAGVSERLLRCAIYRR